MDKAKHKTDSGVWLRRTWNALMCTLDDIDRSPMEDISGRLARLEREVAALKKRST